MPLSDRHIPEEEVTPVILDVEEQSEDNHQVHQTDEHNNLDNGRILGRIVSRLEIGNIYISPPSPCHMHTLYIYISF